MSEFNRKNQKNFWHSPLVLLVIFCIIVLFAYNIVGLLEKERETSKKKQQILAEIETLRNREESLKNDIERLNTDSGIEETIRDKYQVVKDGEKMVVIVDKEEKPEVLPIKEKEDHTFWGWIKKTFRL